MERIYEFNATKIRNIFYCDWCRKINLCDVLKAQTELSLEINFFIFFKRIQETIDYADAVSFIIKLFGGCRWQ